MSAGDADKTGRSEDSVRELVREFLRRRQEDPDLTAAAFAATHPEIGGEFERFLLEATGHSGAEPAGSDRTEPDISDPTWREQGGAGGSKVRIDGRYEVMRTLGQGGFGRVHLVHDFLYKGELRALKMVLPEHSARPEFAARFQNEIRVLRALSHSGIPQIYNDGKTAQGEFYYTMAFVEGRTLSDVLRKEAPLRPERIVHLVRQMLDVLAYAHGKGVVHRDLKPANIMLVDAGSPTEQVKVLDFGIAKVLRPEGDLRGAHTQHTVGGIGTPDYMSPEQVRGQGVDERSDLYALGIIIYQMCSGLLPFAGTTDLEVAAARLERTPSPLKPDAAPDWLRTVVDRLLEREKEKRPTTLALQEQFEQLSKGQRELRGGLRRLTWAGATIVLLAVIGLWRWAAWGAGFPPTPPVDAAEPKDPPPAERGRREGSAPERPVASPSRPELLPPGEDQPTSAHGEAQVPVDPVDEILPLIEWNDLASEAEDVWVPFKGAVRDEHPYELHIRRADSPDTSSVRVELGPDGTFDHRLTLEEGENRFLVEAVDVRGNSSTRTLTITRLAPMARVSLPGLPHGVLRALAAEYELQGEVDRATRVTVNGEEALLEGRVFRHTLVLEKDQTEVEIVPYGEHQRRGEPFIGRILRQEVRLPAGFRPVGSAVDDEGRPHEIRHDRTGVTLRLIPERTADPAPLPAFYLGVTEVTREQYRRVAGEPPAPFFEVDENQPVVNVSFKEASEYCRDSGLRLPTTSEWEYAARGPELRQYPWGDTWIDDGCRHDASAEGPVSVEEYPKDLSFFGVRGLAGNVSEWCSADEDPARPALRGASYTSEAEGCKLQSPKRPPAGASDYIGFRVALEAQ